MVKNDYLYLALLHSIWITQKKLHFIFWEKQNYKDFFDKINYNLLLKKGFLEKQISLILENKKNIKIENIQKKIDDRNVKIVTIFDENYPELLKNIPNSPFLFYLRWKIDNSPKIAVVWSRKISDYWENVIKKIIPNLSDYFTIVSGGAAWCDTLWHVECLKTWNKTLSIIWTWIDIDYPVKNKKLYDEIIEKWWWVLSIFPVWEVWKSYNFPVRNEIVAWLSNWVLVIEAWKRSWTLITANLALDLWKDLFVVPWDIFKFNSIWCNNLIKNWCAKLITESKDILEEYNILDVNDLLKNNTKKTFNDEIEKEIYNKLLVEDLTINELSTKLWLDIQVILFKIGFMEINNYIKKSNWWKYMIC